jgi:hypothetical protein
MYQGKQLRNHVHVSVRLKPLAETNRDYFEKNKIWRMINDQ